MTEHDEILEELREIESRLDKLENNDHKVITSEKIEVEEEGRLGGSETAKENKTLVKTKRIPVCDHCGEKLESEKHFAVCHKDGKKLCGKCSIKFRGKIICPQDLRGILPLSRISFKILVLVANSISNVNALHEISHVPKNDVKQLMQLLLETGYIEGSGFFAYKTTEVGLEAIAAYGQLYGNEADMKELDEELKEFVRRHL